ncbi:MAG: VCBS domain-containing protein [Candidatus Endonucleobacter sp. (ex Gigantidas childressi)]|nr:VCBS domain-containing protein [Candidatus Endonucleobacter sp. (ex Gigantidas childressi)]
MKFYTVVASDGNTFVRDTSGKMIPVKTGDILPETAIIEKGENSQLVLQDGSQTISINTASGFPLSDLLNNTDAYSVNDPDGSTISQNDNAALEPADVPRANKPSQPVDDEILSDMHKAAEVVELKTLNIDVTAGEPGQGLQRENNTIEDEINGSYTLSSGEDALIGPATGPSVTPPVVSTPAGTIDTTAHAKDDTNTATEDQGPTATSGNVLTNDEANSTVTTLGDIKGQYGTYHMQANGDYTYELNNKNPAVQALAVGATLPDPISYTMTDAAGNTASAQLTTTITGTNDAPVLTVGQTTNITGTLTGVDIDTGDILTFAVVHGAGSYGTLTVDPTTGAYTFAQNQSVIGMSLDKTSGKYTGNEVFEVKVTDNHGGTQSKFINFTSEVTLTAPTHTGSSGNQVPTPNVPPILTPSVPNPPVVTDTKPVIPSVTVPNAVTIDLSKTTDSGTSDQDKITNNPKPEITGHTDVPFSKVDILENGNVIGHAFSDKLGNYSIAVPLPTEGAHTLTAQATGPSLTTHGVIFAFSYHN